MTNAPPSIPDAPPPAGPVRIRRATPADASPLLELVRELASYEGSELPNALTEIALRSMLVPPDPRLHVLLAEVGDRLAGYVSFMTRFSAWAASDFIGLDDLYVRAEARGRGIGKALVLEVARIATERGQAMRWEARVDNHAAQAFYRSLGASLTQKVICRWNPTVAGREAP